MAQVVPLIGDIKQKLAGHRFYARFDMTAGFNAVELDPESRDVLTIRTPSNSSGHRDSRSAPRTIRASTRRSSSLW